MKLNRLIALLAVMALWPNKPVFAFNPVQDVLDNTTFPIGQVASAGTAVNLKDGSTATSMLAEIADYRMFALSYGATRENVSGANFSDTLKLGFRLNWLISQFKNDLPPSGQWIKNINVGPSIASNVLVGPRQAVPFFDINYSFGGTTK